MTETQQPPNTGTIPPTQNPIINTVPVVTQTPTKKAPWPYFGLFIISLIFGMPAAILVVWQNLKRIEKHEVAKKFLLISGGLGLLILILIAIISPSSSKVQINSAMFLSLIFPVWYLFSYGKSWEKEHPGQTKWSWTLLGWGVLGYVVSLILSFIINLVLTSFGVIKLP
jgi:hypothetical protein